MSKSSLASQALPLRVEQELTELGGRMKSARIARRWTIADLASRMFVAPATVVRMEKGNPGTSLAVLATALSLFDLVKDLQRVADPAQDPIAQFRQRERQPKRVRKTNAADLDF